MADILKVSVPTHGMENTSRTNPITANDSRISNVVDPAKVVRPDGQSTNPDKGLGMHYESNFQEFIEALQNRPSLIETFSQIFFRMDTMVSSGVGEDFAAEIAQFLEMVKMSPEDMVAFLKEQGGKNNKFASGLFQTLKSVMNSTSSVELKTAVLQFLKSYNDVSASGNTLQNIRSILKSMARYMPKSYGDRLLGAAENLQPQLTPGANEENIAALKKELIPFLSDYTKSTHDMGRVRDLITLLTLNTARYENGTMEKLFGDFQRMASYKDFQKIFGNNLQKILESFLDELTAAKGSEFGDGLIANMNHALEGKGGWEVKSAFQNIMQSLLLNESVYMPLKHYILPAEVFGHFMFSEIWVEPDCGGIGYGSQGEEKTRKLFIKFDIKDVGFFDLIIFNQGDKVDLQLQYPEKFQAMEKEMKKGISALVEKNGMVCRKVYLGKSSEPIALSEVFPEIYERKNAINVKI